MALEMPYETQDGISLGYHRISAVHVFVNESTLVEVESCVDAASRERIRDGEELYRVSRGFQMDYGPEVSIAQAYRELKALEGFEGAQDVFEEGQDG